MRHFHFLTAFARGARHELRDAHSGGRGHHGHHHGHQEFHERAERYDHHERHGHPGEREHGHGRGARYATGDWHDTISLKLNAAGFDEHRHPRAGLRLQRRREAFLVLFLVFCLLLAFAIGGALGYFCFVCCFKCYLHPIFPFNS